MKKLLVFALGLGIALGTVSFSFAQDTTDTTKKAKKAKKKKANKTDTTATK
jgi:nanoRNase/pAp phosphatase (c-di-AMP/oligoRNAs hydrolase)